MNEGDPDAVYFRSVREAFEQLLWDELLVGGYRLDSDDDFDSDEDSIQLLPEPLRTWATLSDAQFAAVLWDKLGPFQGMLGTPIGRARVVERMIQGAASEQPEFVSLLISIKDSPEKLDVFGSFMAVLVDLAPKIK